MPQRVEEDARAMVEALDRYCEPIPPAPAFLNGIAHRNDRRDNAGELWGAVPALASKKVHFRARLQAEVWGVGVAYGLPICEAYPDAVLGDGWTALTAQAFDTSKRVAYIEADDDYDKHILNTRDGEVRHWGGGSLVGAGAR